MSVPRKSTRPFDRATTEAVKVAAEEELASRPEYVIEVVQHVATVTMGSGEHPPLRCAFMAISDNFAEVATDKGSQLEYRITHPTDGHVITISVSDPPFHPTTD